MSTSSHRYVVIGAGAVGAVLAAQLELAGIPVVLVARGEHGRAIERDGLRVRRPAGTDVVPLATVADVTELSLTPDDVLVVATKTQDVEDLLTTLAWQPVGGSTVGDGTVGGGGVAAALPLVTLQNGLASEDVALRRFAHVIGGTVLIAASHLQAGEVVSPSWPVVGVVWLGRHPQGPDAVADEVARDWAAAGFQTAAVDAIGRFKAWKLLGNATNGLDLFTGDPDDVARAGEALVAEARAAFAAAGVEVADPAAEIGFEPGTLKIEPVPGHASGRRSTWQSFARGTSSEVDHLNGEIVLLGRRHSVPTPVNVALQRLLGEQAARGLGAEPIDVTRLLEVADLPTVHV